jgi:hypothetical protein
MLSAAASGRRAMDVIKIVRGRKRVLKKIWVSAPEGNLGGE